MTLRKETIEELKNLFNLNLYEVKLWLALLQKGDSNAGELSKTAEVPRSRSYDTLEGLEKKGFILVKLGKPITYTAIHPDEILERYKNNIKQKAERSVKKIETIKESGIYKELLNIYTSIEATHPERQLSAIKGRMNVYSRMNELIKNAENNIKIITTEKGIKRKSKEFEESLKNARSRGVTVQVLAPVAEDYQKFLYLMNIKPENNINMRFVLKDDKELLLLTNHDEDSDDNGLLIRNDYLGTAFANIFKKYWGE